MRVAGTGGMLYSAVQVKVWAVCLSRLRCDPVTRPEVLLAALAKDQSNSSEMFSSAEGVALWLWRLWIVALLLGESDS